jgi:hypothetical protein
MITARSPIGVLRARVSRGPLWLTLLLLGLLYAHGVSIHSAAHHLSGGGSLSAAPSDHAHAAPAGPFLGTVQSLDGTDGDRCGGSSHPAEECMPVQPQHRAALQVPCSGVRGDTALGSQVPHRSIVADSRVSAMPSAGTRATGVLRI